jgi:hypothetical protein
MFNIKFRQDSGEVVDAVVWEEPAFADGRNHHCSVDGEWIGVWVPHHSFGLSVNGLVVPGTVLRACSAHVDLWQARVAWITRELRKLEALQGPEAPMTVADIQDVYSRAVLAT